jgi:hypothetical protein
MHQFLWLWWCFCWLSSLEVVLIYTMTSSIWKWLLPYTLANTRKSHFKIPFQYEILFIHTSLGCCFELLLADSCVCVLVVLGFELKPLTLLGGHSTSWAKSPALTLDFCYSEIELISTGSFSVIHWSFAHKFTWCVLYSTCISS